VKYFSFDKSEQYINPDSAFYQLLLSFGVLERRFGFYFYLYALSLMSK